MKPISIYLITALSFTSPNFAWGYTVTVQAGQTVSNEIIDSGIQTVNGTTENITITNYGKQDVNNGGIVNNTIVNGMGSDNLTVQEGGIANDTKLNSGWIMVYGEAKTVAITNGSLQVNGSVTDATLTGGTLVINRGVDGVNDPNTGGKTYNTTLTNAVLTNRFGVDQGTAVNEGGLLLTGTIDKGYTNTGTSKDAKINLGGIQRVNNGGTSIGTTVNVGGSLELTYYMHNESSWDNALPSRGTAKDSVIYGIMTSNGGLDSNTTIKEGGKFNLSGNASDKFKAESIKATIEKGGIATLGKDTLAKNWVIQGKTTLTDNTAIIDNSQVKSGGLLQLSAGTANTTSVLSGGKVQVEAYATLKDTTVGGTLIAQSNSNILGNLTISTGANAEFFHNAHTSSATVSVNGDLYLNNSPNQTPGNYSYSFDTLNMNGGTIYFSPLTNNTTSSLTINKLSSSDKVGGVFFMQVDLGKMTGDLINITGTSKGNYILNIKNNGGSNTDGKETLTIVENIKNNANWTLANKVEAGAYEYDIRPTAANANNIELYSNGKTTTTADAATSFLNIGYLTTYIENQTLLQRLGDLRNSEIAGVKSDGLWIKGFGGKLSAFSGSQMKGFDMTYTGTQLGIDKNIDIQNGRLLVGIMAGFTRTNPNYQEGSGTGKNYTVGLYATYLNDKGIYIDNVLKYNSMHNQFNVIDTAGNNIKGIGKTQGIILSTEIGKRFWLANKQQGFYLEPQAQFFYGYQNGDTVNASNGLKVGLSHYNSILGRISGIVGYQIQGENPVNIYVKTGIVREMSGGASYSFNNGEKKRHNFRSSWFDNGIGANITINKQHNIYAEVDYSTGGKFDNAMLNLGYRYSF